MALNRSDKSRILRRYFPGMTRNSEMSTEPNTMGAAESGTNTISCRIDIESGATTGGRSLYRSDCPNHGLQPWFPPLLLTDRRGQ